MQRCHQVCTRLLLHRWYLVDRNVWPSSGATSVPNFYTIANCIVKMKIACLHCTCCHKGGPSTPDQLRLMSPSDKPVWWIWMLSDITGEKAFFWLNSGDCRSSSVGNWFSNKFWENEMCWSVSISPSMICLMLFLLSDGMRRIFIAIAHSAYFSASCPVISQTKLHPTYSLRNGLQYSNQTSSTC